MKRATSPVLSEWSSEMSDYSMKLPSLSDTVEEPLVEQISAKASFKLPWKALKIEHLVHVAAVLASCCLIWLNATPRYWFDSTYSVPIALSNKTSKLVTADLLQILQLVAKLYEVIAIVSISTIVLGIYLSTLAVKGLPLGLITGGYRVGNLGYLTHSGLWSAIRTKAGILAGITITCTLWSIAIGPSSAILLVPSPTWWPVQRSKDGIEMALYGPPGNWATVLEYNADLDTDPMAGCYTGNHYDLSRTSCPGYGLGQILSVVSSIQSSMSTNIVVPTSATGYSRWLKTSRIRGSINQTAVATTLSDHTVEAMSQAGRYSIGTSLFGSSGANLRISSSATDGIFQPLVQAKCSVFVWNSTSETIRSDDPDNVPIWPTTGLECFDDSNCSAWVNLPPKERALDSSQWAFEALTGKLVDFQWVDMPNAPLSAVFRVPRNVTRLNGTDPNGPETIDSSSLRKALEPESTEWNIGACSLITRWVYSSAKAEIGQSYIVESNVTDPGTSNINETTLLQPGLFGTPIVIKPSWARLLNFELGNYTKTSSYTDFYHTMELNALDTFLAQLVSVKTSGTSLNFTSQDGDSVSSTMESFLSLLLADAISRSTTSGTEDRAYVAAHLGEEGLVAIRSTSEAHNFNSADNFGVSLTPSTGSFGQRQDRLESLLSLLSYDGGGAAYTKVSLTVGNNSCATVLTQEIQPGEKTVMCDSLSFGEYIRGLRPDTSMPWSFVSEQYGYGSGRASSTVTFAMVMVCFYLGVVVLHTAHAIIKNCFKNTVRRSGAPSAEMSSWSDVQDLMALGLASRPPGTLSEMTGGIKAFSGHWGQILTLRVNGENCVQFIAEEVDVDN